jgi:hypothetical protein
MDALDLLCLPFDNNISKILTISSSDQVVILGLTIACTLGFVAFLLGRINSMVHIVFQVWKYVLSQFIQLN